MKRRLGFRGVVWAVVAVTVVAVGFARSFFLRPVFSTDATPGLAPHVLVHGLVMTGWLALFLVQAVLGATHRVRLHRQLGWLGVGWYAAVLVLGLVTTLRSVGGDTRDPEGLAFVAFAAMDLVVFGALTGAGLWWRKRPAIHRRLMVLGTLSTLPPAIARLPLGFIRSGGDGVQLGLAVGLALAFVAFDTWRERRLHPAAAWGWVAFAASAPLRLWLGSTPTWQQLAAWLVAHWG